MIVIDHTIQYNNKKKSKSETLPPPRCRRNIVTTFDNDHKPEIWFGFRSTQVSVTVHSWYASVINIPKHESLPKQSDIIHVYQGMLNKSEHIELV